ncbi:ALP1-like protein isoform X1 [Tanacetum coccineum]
MRHVRLTLPCLVRRLGVCSALWHISCVTSQIRHNVSLDYGICTVPKEFVIERLSNSSPMTYNEIPTHKAYPMCETVPCDQIVSVSKVSLFLRPVCEGKAVLAHATPSDPLQVRDWMCGVKTGDLDLWVSRVDMVYFRVSNTSSPALIALEADQVHSGRELFRRTKACGHVVDYGVGLLGSLQPPPVALNAGGLSDGPKRRRTYIFREREEAEQRLIDDYFGDDEYEPKYPEEKFRRSAHPPYGTAPDAFDEYLQIVERTSRECLDHFTKCIHVLYHNNFLRMPTATDIQKTYQLHEEKHGLPGMLGSIDCMHWDWKNYPKALHGQFKRSTHKYPTLMLEVVADQKLWIWHAYFGVPGANNDLNVLYGSPLFDDEIADIAPECPFVVNGHTYRKCYYLTDDILTAWLLCQNVFFCKG